LLDPLAIRHVVKYRDNDDDDVDDVDDDNEIVEERDLGPTPKGPKGRKFVRQSPAAEATNSRLTFFGGILEGPWTLDRQICRYGLCSRPIRWISVEDFSRHASLGTHPFAS
jgi:hypothetical protein